MPLGAIDIAWDNLEYGGAHRVNSWKGLRSVYESDTVISARSKSADKRIVGCGEFHGSDVRLHLSTVGLDDSGRHRLPLRSPRTADGRYGDEIFPWLEQSLQAGSPRNHSVPPRRRLDSARRKACNASPGERRRDRSVRSRASTPAAHDATRPKECDKHDDWKEAWNAGGSKPGTNKKACHWQEEQAKPTDEKDKEPDSEQGQTRLTEEVNKDDEELEVEGVQGLFVEDTITIDWGTPLYERAVIQSIFSNTKISLQWPLKRPHKKDAAVKVLPPPTIHTQKEKLEAHIKGSDKLVGRWLPGHRWEKLQEFALSRANAGTERPSLTKERMKVFKSFLREKFGSLVRAWRLALDTTGRGAITRQEFCRNVRALGFTHSIPLLWNELDVEASGLVTMVDLCPADADELDSFKGVLQTKYRTAQEAWRGLATNGQATLTLKDFSQACRKLGWTHKPDAMAKQLLGDLHGGQLLTMSDLVWLGLPTRDVKEPTAHERRHALAQQSLHPHITSVRALNTPQEFKDELLKLCGNMAQAWRRWLSPEGKPDITMEEFWDAAKDLGYAGPGPALWKSVTRGQETLTLKLLAPHVAEELGEFRGLLRSKHETAAAAWVEIFGGDVEEESDANKVGDADGKQDDKGCETSDVPEVDGDRSPGKQDIANDEADRQKRSKTCQAHEFERRCAEIGWKRDAARLRRLLESEEGNVTLRDIRWVYDFDGEEQIQRKADDEAAKAKSKGGAKSAKGNGPRGMMMTGASTGAGGKGKSKGGGFPRTTILMRS